MFELKSWKVPSVFSARVYALPFIFCLGLLSRGHHNNAILLFTLVAIGFFALHYAFRVFACAKRIWDKIPEKFHWYRKKVFWLITALVVFVSNVSARNTVANVFHMPANDFPNTTKVMTLFESAGIWLFVGMVISSVLFLIKFGKIGCLVISSEVARMGSLLWAMLGQDSSSLARFEDEQHRKGLAVVGDIARNFALLVVLGLCLFLGPGPSVLWTNVVKWVAYLDDYDPATSYPGLDRVDHDPTTRVIADSNGTVSIARVRGLEVIVDPPSPKR